MPADNKINKEALMKIKKLRLTAIILFCILLLGALVGCGANEDKYPKFALNAEPGSLTNDAIIELNDYYKSLNGGKDYFTVEGLYPTRHYGTYNGCVVLFNPAIAGAITTKVYADEIFKFNTSFAITVFKDGIFADFEEAIENGWITKDEVVTIAEHHDSRLPDYLKKVRIEIDGTDEPNTISSEILVQLTNAYNERENFTLNTFVHYGTYDGVAVLYSSGEGYPYSKKEPTPDGTPFSADHEFIIVLFKNGHFGRLSGQPFRLSKEQIADLYEYFQSQHNK